MNLNAKIFIIIIVFLIVGTVSTAFIRGGGGTITNEPGKYDTFAQCLKDKGAIFYGAFWCPHCQKQKKLFGSSAKYLPYVECSTADGQGMLPICSEKKVPGYPTWDLADGTRLANENDGGVTLETLSAKTGCVLPQ